MNRVLFAPLLTAVVLTSAPALADDFTAGSVIIPMDTDYQDHGMLKAYGLVYELLLNDIDVYWVIRQGKARGGADFTTDAVDYESDAPISMHGYRGGPWVISADNQARALPIIDAWQASHTTAVHIAAADFDADVSRHLVLAPNIAMFADGNQGIARGYLQAAGIPDSTLDPAWPASSPDMLTPDEVSGPTTANHSDGGLFDEDGDPVYCQLMSMHWGVSDARDQPEVVAEVREFLGHPTHFFAECQAVNAFENDTEFGLFLTTSGFDIADKPSAVDFFNHDSPFAQMDGAFGLVGGSEPAYTLPDEGEYKARNSITMITERGTVPGTGDVWMTGFVDGACELGQDNCNRDGGCSASEQKCLSIGKVSYLGGHQYDTKLPMSANPKTQGTRLFLNSLFEAPCATAEGLPDIHIEKQAPATTTTGQLTFTVSYDNDGPGVALDAVLNDTLPAGTSFVSASAGGVLSGGVVTWDLGNLGVSESGSVSLTVSLAGYATYVNQASLGYRVGLNHFTYSSNETSTIYDADSDGDDIVDSVDVCPDDYNPGQDLLSDVDSCGTCGNDCATSNGTPSCASGTCVVDSCDSTHSDCDGSYATGCEYVSADFDADEANCGGCNVLCEPSNATGDCVAGSCTVGDCETGYSDCNQLVADGCEYDETNLATDPKNCGGCGEICTDLEVCVGGSCEPNACALGSAECDGAVPDDCETNLLSDPDNCGGCSLVCAPANGTASCESGVCTIGICDDGFSDCNGLSSDGCEYDDSGFEVDMNNCGGCGQACSNDNGTASCEAGVCTIGTCVSGFSDCNGSASDGCEHDDSDFETDVANCGGCALACTGANSEATCLASNCSIVDCDAGFFDLDGDPANGCEYVCTVTGDDESACNSADDDCDGAVDEDYEPGACGVGACVASTICVNGEESCTPTEAATETSTSPVTCVDDVDNDCDGAIDESDPDCSESASDGAGGSSSSTGGSGGTSSSVTGTLGSGGSAGADNTSTSTSTGAGAAGGSPSDVDSATASDGGPATGGTGAGDTAGPGSSNTGGNSGDDAGGSSSTSGDNGQTGASTEDSGGCGCRTDAGRSAPGIPGQGLLMLVALAGTAVRRRSTLRGGALRL